MSYYQNVIKCDSVRLERKREQWRNWYQKNRTLKLQENDKYHKSAKNRAQEAVISEFKNRKDPLLCVF